MSPGLIRGDAKFVAFQEKLATVVVSARARGVTISNRYEPGCKCPLGAHPDAKSSHPPSRYAQQEGWPEVEQPNLLLFIRGYHGDDEVPSSPYADLGRAYAEQFP